MSASLFAGIDAGGTSTRCVVADDLGTLLGAAAAGPGNPLLNGPEPALAAIAAALSRALGGRPAAALVHLHITAAGAGVPEGVHTLAAACSSSHDAAGAFSGALVQGPGVMVIAGTGSACYAEDSEGRAITVGGWGPLLGDEGSAYAIGRGALQRLAWALDGRAPRSRLTASLLDLLGVTEPFALQRRLYEPPVSRDWVASLAALVADAARAGDRHALSLLSTAGSDLGQHAVAAARLLRLQDTALRVSTAGGVYSAGPLVLDAFARRIRRTVPRAQIVVARYPPVIGALLRAYLAAGRALDPPLLQRLDAGAARLASGLHL